ncbi:TPA: hypothetical protein ACIVGF_002890 [Salmonella enterica subsp. enterica serovar 16:l,v:-]|nr:hypothetical protein [Salmonella enterica]
MSDNWDKILEVQYARLLETEPEPTYLILPGESVDLKTLTQPELRVRSLADILLSATKTLNGAKERLDSSWFFLRKRRAEDYRDYKEVHDFTCELIERQINKTPEFKAALRRLVDAMPSDYDIREILENILRRNKYE